MKDISIGIYHKDHQYGKRLMEDVYKRQITSMIKKRYHMIMEIKHRVKEWSRHDKQNQRHTENS